MPAWHGRTLVLTVGMIVMAACAPGNDPVPGLDEPGALRPLPEPADPAPGSLEEVIAERRSVRDYADRGLADADVGQLLWAAQGITHPSGKRTAPSAGATYPLEVYAATADGVARYRPDQHSLEVHAGGDRRADLAAAALGQEAVADAPLVVVFSGVVERTAARYGDRATRYVLLEAGHAAQNVLLQAVSLGLAAVPIGAFDDDEVAEVLELPADQEPLYLIPVAHPAD